MYGRNTELISQLLKENVWLHILRYTSICIRTLPLNVHTYLCQCTRTLLFIFMFVCACICYSKLKKKSLMKELWPGKLEREC